MTLSYDFIRGRYFIEDIHILREKKAGARGEEIK
jgi:hypothetical protein